jgi:hopene-associated glycosyltransferase HpnB
LHWSVRRSGYISSCFADCSGISLKFDDDHRILSAPATFPSVSIVVPARNEAPTIGATVSSLLQQDYPGEFSLVVVDDHSEDDTGKVASNAALQTSVKSNIANFAVYAARPFEDGWTGKLWALNEGVLRVCDETARTMVGSPEFFWFTDADIAHAPDTLRRLVNRAEGDHLDLASLMVLLRANTTPEKLLIPAFVYFFLKLYPPAWVAEPNRHTAGAAGGCLLIRHGALQRIGGLKAIRDAVIDDCALAKAVKQSGGRIRLGVTRASQSLRDYPRWRDIRDMVARTAFTQLRYSATLLAMTILGLFITYLVPIGLVLASGFWPRALGLLSYTLMSASFLPTIRYYRRSPAWSLALPVIAIFYAHATVLSAVRYWLGRGAQWKGRSQAPASR